jgi:hypothetical protein
MAEVEAKWVCLECLECLDELVEEYSFVFESGESHMSSVTSRCREQYFLGTTGVSIKT